MILRTLATFALAGLAVLAVGPAPAVAQGTETVTLRVDGMV